MTSSRLRYQDLRGLTRNFSVVLPVTRSQVHLTSAAVNGLPSCHLTPSRSLKVSSFPSSLHDHLEARSGTIELRVVCGTCWSNMTRLLNTPIIGPSTTIVDCSWIDTLAMLVPSGILRMPPGFCARAGSFPQSGRIEARTGLRMMPTSPRSPLSFRTAGSPQYGWKDGVSDGALPTPCSVP